MAAASSSKLREIKLRQQNWLREREATIKDESASNNNDSKCAMPSSARGNTRKSKDYNQSTTNSTCISTVEKLNQNTRPKANFQQWLASKNKGTFSDENDPVVMPCKDNTVSTNLPSFGTTESNQHGYHAKNYSADTKKTIGKQEKLLSADQFDDLADSIVRKVKNELKLPSQDSSVDSQQFTDSSQSTCSSATSGRSPMDSHVCPDCQNVMLDPDHSPMLVIPCGHTLCRSCSSQCDMCPLCNCEMNGATPNIMLQQVIADFCRSIDKPEVRTPKQVQCYPKSRSFDPDVDYQEQYNSLCLRCDVLQSESEDIHHNIHKLNQEIEKNHEQVANIDRQEKRLNEQIEEIQGQINCLQMHKAEYRSQEGKVKAKIDKQKAKLDMIDQTVIALQSEAEKIKILAAEQRS